MIQSVYLFVGGMIMVFDEHGQQVPDYQGHARDVAERLLQDAPPTTRWHFGKWRGGGLEVTRDEWKQIALPLSADLDPRGSDGR